MRRVLAFAVLIALAAAFAACRGERPPRDYQNAPPAMTHPPHSAAQTPAQNGMPAAAPEPNKGVEGPNVTQKPATALPPANKPPQSTPATSSSTTT